LRELNTLHPLIFLPSHRSYADTLVLAGVLARHDFPRNHVMGGSNLSFWPVAPLARRAGMVFIRRSFGDDEIYKAVVQEYFGYLLSKRFNLEWYFEGGRSRTGKLPPPATVCCATSPLHCRAVAWRRSTSFQSRSPTNVCTKCQRWQLSSRVQPRRTRAWPG